MFSWKHWSRHRLCYYFSHNVLNKRYMRSVGAHWKKMVVRFCGRKTHFTHRAREMCPSELSGPLSARRMIAKLKWRLYLKLRRGPNFKQPRKPSVKLRYRPNLQPYRLEYWLNKNVPVTGMLKTPVNLILYQHCAWQKLMKLRFSFIPFILRTSISYNFQARMFLCQAQNRLSGKNLDIFIRILGIEWPWFHGQ